MPASPPVVMAVPLCAAALAVLVAGCVPSTSGDGPVVAPEDQRVPEVRAAREALAEPVPGVLAEAERLLGALEQVWTEEAPAADRAELAEALRLAPYEEAVADLDAVELEGQGPDVAAAREVVDAMVADGRALVEVVEEELSSVTAVASFDQQLQDLLARWDARGSYSQQLTAFDELATELEELATTAADRTATPSCTGLWERRAEAATTAVARTEELHALVRDRRGQEFDELRDEYGQDPYGLGARLGELDAAAAEDCWREASEAVGAVELLQSHGDELVAVLDPEDLGG